MLSAARSAKISMILCMLERVSGGDAKFQGFCDRWNKWEGQAMMNAVDWALTDGAVLTWWVVPIMLAAGFVTPLPYNYWRLKALGRACH